MSIDPETIENHFDQETAKMAKQAKNKAKKIQATTEIEELEQEAQRLIEPIVAQNQYFDPAFAISETEKGELELERLDNLEVLEFPEETETLYDFIFEANAREKLALDVDNRILRKIDAVEHLVKSYSSLANEKGIQKSEEAIEDAIDWLHEVTDLQSQIQDFYHGKIAEADELLENYPSEEARQKLDRIPVEDPEFTVPSEPTMFGRELVQGFIEIYKEEVQEAYEQQKQQLENKEQEPRSEWMTREVTKDDLVPDIYSGAMHDLIMNGVRYQENNERDLSPQELRSIVKQARHDYGDLELDRDELPSTDQRSQEYFTEIRDNIGDLIQSDELDEVLNGSTYGARQELNKLTGLMDYLQSQDVLQYKEEKVELAPQ